MNNELKNAIQHGYDYYLDISDGRNDHIEQQKILEENGYLLTTQVDYTMCYELPNEHDTFNVKNRHNKYMSYLKSIGIM